MKKLLSNQNLIILLFFLNALDAGFTFVWLKLGVAVEFNPLLKDFTPEQIMALKVFIGANVTSVLMVFVDNRLIRPLTGLALVAYAVIIVYHLHFLAKAISMINVYINC